MSTITYRKGRNTFYYRYYIYIDGKRKEKSINLNTDSPSQAQKLQEALDQQILQGKDPKRLQKVSLADYLPVLREKKLYRKRSTSTIESHDTMAKKLFESEIIQKPVVRLTTKEIENYLRSLDYSYSYIRKMKTTISQCLKMALVDGVVDRNVADGIELYWIRKPNRKRAFTIDELKSIFTEADRLDQLKGTDKGKIYRLLFYTGMRRNEVLLFHREYYDRNNGVIIYPADAIKSRRDTVKYLNKKAKEIIEWYLQTYPEYEMPILRDNSPKWYPSSITTHFRRMLNRLGIKDASLHTFRHTFTTLLASNNDVGLMNVKGLAGHQDIRTTMGYSHPIDKALKEAVEKLPEIDVD